MRIAGRCDQEYGRVWPGGGDLVGQIVYRAEVWAEEREVIQEQGWEGHEVRILDVGLLLDCLEGCFLEVQVRSLQVEV